MAEIIARFADGRLLIQEDRLVETDTTSGGYATLRIGHVTTIEKVLSIDAQISGYPGQKLATGLKDVLISGDILRVQLRRCDLGVPTLTGAFVLASGLLSGVASGIQGPLSGIPGAVTLTGPIGSGTAALAYLSGVTSGRGYYATLASGALVSGMLRILANVIGY
ncbi:MAG: hypothetical protein Q7J06_08525 [Bacteroidales bacterium]|nr:hypothetical protein [Bacteroidales bacterium]